MYSAAGPIHVRCFDLDRGPIKQCQHNQSRIPIVDQSHEKHTATTAFSISGVSQNFSSCRRSPGSVRDEDMDAGIEDVSFLGFAPSFFGKRWSLQGSAPRNRALRTAPQAAWQPLPASHAAPVGNVGGAQFRQLTP